MPTTVLSRQRSWIALLAVLAMVASLMAIATPARAALVAIDTSATCPDVVPSAGFTDLGGLNATTVQAINCLAFYDISKGTSATTYSPNNSVARWQMALFLTRTLTTMGVALPSGADQGFTDIGGLDAATQKAINQLKQMGITQGTAATTFSPDNNVSRWQMALFLTRTLEDAGNVLPDGSDQGFTDIGAYDAATQKAINQTAQLGVSNGTSSSTFAPDPDTLRWHMALFLIRSLAVDGVVPSGIGAFVTAITATSYTYADAAACKTVKVTYKTTDSKFVNGIAATNAAFDAALATLDFGGGTNNGQIVNVDSSHLLTTGVTVKSGPVAHFGGGFVQLEEPVSGNWTADRDYGAMAFEFFVVDGTATTLTGFNNDLSVGDSFTESGGNGTTAAKATTFTLANGTVSGKVSNAVAIEIDSGCQVFDVGTWAVGDSITVDGVADDGTVFDAEISTDDTLTYSYKAGKGTWVLTNGAPALKTGEAAFNDGGGNVFDVFLSATSTVTLDLDQDNLTNPWDTLKLNGANATVGDIVTALTPGDIVKYRFADTDTSTKSSLEVIDAAYTGAPGTRTGGNGIKLFSFGTSGSELDGINYTDPNDPLLGPGFDTNTSVVYTHNGASVSEVVFEANVDAAIANGNGNVTASDSGTKTTWALTTP